jgi:DNA polymerase-4
MDAFYASVEQRDNPDYVGRPVAVGGSTRRGVVAAASYEARKFGVRSAMPSVTALQRCPDLIFVKPRFDVYKEVSRQIREIFRKHTDLVEPLSLDEAYLDVSEPKLAGTDVEIAQSIKGSIRQITGLTASAGISFNKFLAKTASDVDKPDGLFIIRPEEADAFLARLAIEDFHGVGRATARRMKERGIYTGADLRARSEDELVSWFGKSGRFFHRIVRGEDHREVKPNRVRKSVGAERTFFQDLKRMSEMEERIGEIAARVSERMSASGVAGRTITLKVKYHDFTLTTRSTTLHHDVHEAGELRSIGAQLLRQPAPASPVRLLGLSVSNLVQIDGEHAARQLTLEL